MKRYCFVTGATGLLGSYLMRDCLRHRQPIAVLVRKSRLESARQRVETILARWENQMGCMLPRPVVLEGDIGEENLGLASQSRQWVRENCNRVLHSAASLSFEADEATNEPWRSNFEGTRHVLDFARGVGIRHFHHVSTSYVCGLRTGTILESEVDVGQALSNVYEQSKLSAEKLVREADGLDRVTIYRPAIIVGDSQTGFTSTYHGFYTPLKVVHSLVGNIAPSDLNVLMLLQALGLTGQERKNFVPVDWVSSVMVHILSDESLHGQTYHLTPRTRVSIDEMTAVLSDAIEKLSVPALEKQRAAALDSAAFEEVFRTQMQTYQSYWRDDPEFDARNTIRAAPHLPCPLVDAEVMWRLAKYAIDNNFGWPVPPPLRAPLDIQAQLIDRVASCQGTDRERIDPHDRCLVLEVAGPGGGQWTLEMRNNRLARLTDGCVSDLLPHAYMSSHTFRRLSTAQTSAAQALRMGAIVVSGAGMNVEPVLQVIDQAVGQRADQTKVFSPSSDRSLAS